MLMMYFQISTYCTVLYVLNNICYSFGNNVKHNEIVSDSVPAYINVDSLPIEEQDFTFDELPRVLQRTKRSRVVWHDLEEDEDTVVEANPFVGFGSDHHEHGSRRSHRHRGHQHDHRRSRSRHLKGMRSHRRRGRILHSTLPTMASEFLETSESPEPQSSNMRERTQSVVHVSTFQNIPTGQIIRLGGGGDHNEGRVEVYQSGRWGVVCDDSWDIRDAHIVCKQLGFTRGAGSAIGGSYYGRGSYTAGDILMDEVSCQGFESKIQQCAHSTVHDCNGGEMASVVCMPNTGCSDGWIAGNGLCYKMLHQMTTFETAAKKCKQLDAHLVTIENQQESDFLNNWIVTVSNETYFWTAGRKIQIGENEIWNWQDTLYRVGFTKWFPGWPPSGVSRQPSNHQGQDCIALAKAYFDSSQKVKDVGYFFWNDAPCTVQLPYICERVARHLTDCYKDNGDGYRGGVYRTQRGTLCQKWTLSPKINPSTHPNKGLGNHNLCRNPDNDTRPWCWIDISRGRFGYCALEKCDLSTTNIPPERTTMSTAGSTPYGQTSTTTRQMQRPADECPSGEMKCHNSDSRFCIPTRWRCDGDEDCPGGEDEQLCATSLPKFVKHPGQQLIIPPDDTTVYFKESHSFMSAEGCAEKCLNARDFVCRAFDHKRTGAIPVCTMYNITSKFVGVLSSSDDHDFYENKLQAVNCTSEFFLCGNGRCIEKTGLCNGKDDCNDFSDEQSCMDSSQSIEVRLRGGEEEHEGRVEVKYMGEWGVICDDSWDIKDADVICRQLGYVGAVVATILSKYGPGNANILLDEVQCNGTETLLQNCVHAPWRQHDCRSFEVAGVVCKIGKSCDISSEFECHDGQTCVPLTFVCDDESDCMDGSDEKDCYESNVKVELVGGESEREGRVEFTINGIRGTVCDDKWDDLDAMVICRMLGLDGPARAVGGAHFGAGINGIWFDEVQCNGDESSIVRCAYSGLANHNCAHSEDAGVICGAPSTSTSTTVTNSRIDTSTPATSLSSECGRRPIRQPSSRIVGGFTAQYGAYPWQVGLSKRTSRSSTVFRHWCGGTILSDRWILTAAHCLVNHRKNDFKIRVGDSDVRLRDRHEQQFEVEEIVNHELYTRTPYMEVENPPLTDLLGESFFDSFLSMFFDRKSSALESSRAASRATEVTTDYDIALVKIKPGPRGEVIRFNDHVQPACLANQSTPYTVGHRCHISGWGSLGWSRTGHSYPRYLQAADVPLIAGSQCSRLYKYAVTPRMFCAGHIEGNIDSCQGDSGGPLVCPVNGDYTVLGVVSWGHGCAKPNAPGVYTNVGNLYDWIQQKLQLFS